MKYSYIFYLLILATNVSGQCKKILLVGLSEPIVEPIIRLLIRGNFYPAIYKKDLGGNLCEPFMFDENFDAKKEIQFMDGGFRFIEAKIRKDENECTLIVYIDKEFKLAVFSDGVVRFTVSFKYNKRKNENVSTIDSRHNVIHISKSEIPKYWSNINGFDYEYEIDYNEMKNNVIEHNVSKIKQIIELTKLSKNKPLDSEISAVRAISNIMFQLKGLGISTIKYEMK